MDDKKLAELLQKKVAVYNDVVPIEEKSLTLNKIGLDDLLWAADEFLHQYPIFTYRNSLFNDKNKRAYNHANKLIKNIPYNKKDIEHFCIGGLWELKNYSHFRYLGIFISALMNNPKIEEKEFSLTFLGINNSLDYLGAFSNNMVLEVRGKSKNLHSLGYCAKKLKVFAPGDLGDYLGHHSKRSEYYVKGNAGTYPGFGSKKSFFWVGGDVISCTTTSAKSTFLVEGNIGSVTGEGKCDFYVGGRVTDFKFTGKKTRIYAGGKLLNKK